MDMNTYQRLALRTASETTMQNPENMLLNGVMGLNGEAGEAIDIVKKFLFQGHTLDNEHIAKEIGDILWYCAIAAKGAGYMLDDIAEMNISKLEARYPDGFNAENSLHRASGDI